MHAIDSLAMSNNIPVTEVDKLQAGRLFLNMVKDNEPHFSSWNDGISAIRTAWLTLDKHKMSII